MKTISITVRETLCNINIIIENKTGKTSVFGGKSSDSKQ